MAAPKTGLDGQVSEDRTRDLERISAYVDGELDPAARAEVLLDATEDPDFARELIAQQRLKGALAGAVPVPDIALPVPPRRRRLALAATSIAASLVLLAAAALVGTVYDRRATGDGALALEDAIAAHRGWTAQAATPPAGPALRPAAATIGAYLPDLSANGLSLGHVSERPGPDGAPMLIAGYVGSRGCRVTLLVHKAAGTGPGRPVHLEAGPVLAFSWRADGLDYRLLAEGMAAARFRLVSGSVRRASLNHLPLDPDTRTAMARSRAESPPCAA